MASEALAGEADKSSASPLPSEGKAAGNQAVNPINEKNSSEHVSDARAEATQQQHGNGSSNSDVAAASQAPSVQKSNAILCGICESNPGKYKCSRCRLPYCSVACSKTHQQNHPPDPPKEDPKPTDQASNTLPAVAASANVPSPGHIDPTNPFSALATSDRLQLLFRKYPNLPNQLLEIHAATQPPPEAPDAASKAIPASLMKGLPPSSGKPTWNHDIGIKNGKAALRKARKASGQDGEAIREYTELILHIMNETGDRNTAAAYVQRQIAEQDTALIERLLAEDRRNE